MGPTYLEANQGFTFIILVGRGAGCFASDDGELHVLDLEAYEKEIDAAYNDILQVVLVFGVFKFDVQTILDTDIHLDRTVGLRRQSVRVDPDILFTNDGWHSPREGGSDEVSQLHIDSIVGLVLLFDVFEVEGECLWVMQFARGCEFLNQGEKFIMIATIIEHL